MAKAFYSNEFPRNLPLEDDDDSSSKESNNTKWSVDLTFSA